MLNRKILSIFFAAIISIPGLLSVYLYSSQLVVQYRMREELEQSSLVTVVVPACKLQWTRPGKEASIDGNLFDVKSYRLINDHFVLTGLFDKEEDLLIKHIAHLQQKSANRTNSGPVIFKWLSSFPIHLEEGGSNTALSTLHQQYPLPAAINFHSNKVVIDTPPPKFT